MSTPKTNKYRNILPLTTFGIGVGIGFVIGYFVTKKLSPHKEKHIVEYKMNYRRIVTGHDNVGKSMIVLNDSIPNNVSMPSFSIDVYNIWRCLDHNKANKDSDITLTDLCNQYNKIPLEPNMAGSNFRIVEFRPESDDYKELYNDRKQSSKDMIKNAWKDFGVESDGNVYNESDKKHPFMHCTQSMDYAICLYGKIVLVLDKSETIVKAGDFVVQRATNHAWKNIFDDACIICFVLIHADSYQSS